MAVAEGGGGSVNVYVYIYGLLSYVSSTQYSRIRCLMKINCKV
jgi:hypothetical protein